MQYYDPWAKVGDAATNAVAKYYMSKPTAAEMAAAQSDMMYKTAGAEARRAQAEASRASVGTQQALANKYQLEGRRLQDQMNSSTDLANLFSSIMAPVEQQRPMVEQEMPLVGPMPGMPAIPPMIPTGQQSPLIGPMQGIEQSRPDVGQTGFASEGPMPPMEQMRPMVEQSIPFDTSMNYVEQPRPMVSQQVPMAGPMPMGAPDPTMVQQRYQQNIPDLFSTAMRFSADKPGSLGDVYRAIAGAGGASDQVLTDAQLGAGDNYANTKLGFEADPDNQGYTLSAGNIRFDNNNEQVASAPFKPAAPAGSFSTTLPDGTTFDYSGKLDPAKPTVNKLQEQQISAAKMRGLINYTRDLAKKDPTNFGFPGFVKGTVQDVTSLTQGVAQSMGYNSSSDALVDTQREIAQAGVDPSLLSGVFDPDLPALQTTSDLLVFQAASALAGQDGRSVSDRDVTFFKRLVGDPRSFLTTQEKFLAKLTTIENILSINEQVADTTLGGNVVGPNASNPASPIAGESSWSEEEEREYRELEALMGSQ